MRSNNLLYSNIMLPSPMNLSVMWNGGSMLLIILAFQIGTGLILSMHYSNDMVSSFSSIIHITNDVSYGSLLRMSHANGASLFFMVIYAHTCRGIYYKSYITNTKTWMSGVVMMLVLMAIAFLGYVLPWGQMSYWGATVITNLLSAVPYLGTSMVNWLWGSYSVSGATLNRFFSFHFILPFLLLFLSMTHLVLLHEKGSTNVLGNTNNFNKVAFHPYFTSKDIVGFMALFMFLTYIIMYYPYLFGDCENFIEANSMVTPVHIQPEWYFLFAYAILRSVPNKLGGVICMFLSIVGIMLLGLSSSKINYPSYTSMKFMFNFWLFVSVFIMLTWLGSMPVEQPYILMGQFFSVVYFTIMINFIFL